MGSESESRDDDPVAVPPRPERRPRRDSRGELLDAALEIILERGVDGLKIEDVCERVGVTKGSLYWHFHDREGLIREALLEQMYRMAEEKLDTLSTAIDSATGRDDYLMKVVGAQSDPFDADEVETRWQRLEIITAARRDPGLWAMMCDVQRRQQRFLVELMESASARGILRDDVDPKAMAAALTALGMGSNLLTLLGDDGPTAEAWTMFQLVLVDLLFPPA